MEYEETTVEFGTGLREHLLRNPCWLADSGRPVSIDALFAIFASADDVPAVDMHSTALAAA